MVFVNRVWFRWNTVTPKTSKADSDWHRTDNAGRIFASLQRWQTTSVFRVSATLKEPISLRRLEKSLERVLKQMPYFNVLLREGFFWCYFSPNRRNPGIERDSRYPCNEFRFRKRKSPPFRVRVFHKRIALEVAHVLTDGTGALTLLQAILADYVGENSDDLFEGAEPGRYGEKIEDAFRKYHRAGLPAMERRERAFQIPGEREMRGVRHIHTGVFSVSEALSFAKSHGATLGEFFIAAYLFSIYEMAADFSDKKRRRLLRPIRLDVPVNLRTHLPSETMRNFFLPTYPEIDPRLGDYTFEEVLQIVHYFMKGVLQEKYFLKMIGRNVGAEQNPFLRSVPLFLKNLIVPEIYTRWNLTQATSGFSNLGPVSVSERLEAHIERFDFVPTHPSTRGVSCGMISFRERLHVCFNSVLTEPTVERYFFRLLSRMGMHIRLESNQVSSKILI